MTAHGSATRVIAGYEVTRFGVPMIGQYVNTGRGRRVTISPAVPGAQYRITAWALGDGRSATPAVVEASGECYHWRNRLVTLDMSTYALYILTYSYNYMCYTVQYTLECMQVRAHTHTRKKINFL